MTDALLLAAATGQPELLVLAAMMLALLRFRGPIARTIAGFYKRTAGQHRR